jgi:hypothetical protein
MTFGETPLTYPSVKLVGNFFKLFKDSGNGPKDKQQMKKHS